MKRWLLTLLLGLPLWAGAADLYLVRHAEKQTAEDPDPGLTAQGLQRSRDLAVWLSTAGIERIYSSNYRRTRLTAAPLALALGLELEIYDPRDLDALARQLVTRDENALVVGHSNTTPQLATALGGDSGPPLPESEYGRLYLIERSTEAVRTRIFYQPPSSPPPH